MDPQSVDAPSARSDPEAYTLLLAAQQGRPEAVDALLEVWRTYLLRIANDELDTKLQPKLGASDVVQESLMLAHQHLGEFRGQTRQEMAAWLKRILRNRLTDTRRHYLGAEMRQADREIGLFAGSASGDAARDLSAGIDTPSGNVSAQEEADRVARALEGLPEDQRQVIQLRNWDRLSFAEIGERMNRSAEAVRKLWARAIERLQEQLERGDSQ